MMQKQEKQQVKYNQICLMPFLLQAIRHNQSEIVRQMLEINHNYFYEEDQKSVWNRNTAWLEEESLDARKEMVYTEEAVRQQNPEILKLLVSYGFKTTLFRKVKNKEEPLGEEFSSLNPFSVPSPHRIDKLQPFITEEEGILSILLDGVEDINEEHNVYWEDERAICCYRSMSLLAIAIQFNQIRIADLLVRSGALLPYHFMKVLMGQSNFAVGLGMGIQRHSPAISGYVEQGVYMEDIMIQKLMNSPVALILRGARENQINWLKLHLANNPTLGKEIKLVGLYLEGERYQSFTENFPELADTITRKDIIRSSNTEALRYYIRRKGKILASDLLMFLNFDHIMNRSWEEITRNILIPDFSLCLREIFHQQPELLQRSDVQNKILNVALFLYCIECMDVNSLSSLTHRLPNLIEDDHYLEEINKNADNLLRLYHMVTDEEGDVTEFIQWYYNNAREHLKRNDRISYSKQLLRNISKRNPDKKARLNVSWIECKEDRISQTEISEILDLFDLDYNCGELSQFHKVIIDKGNTNLLKKLIKTHSYPYDLILQMAEYAISSGSQKMVPVLLVYKMKYECDARRS